MAGLPVSEYPKDETDELLPLNDPEVKGFPETASSQISSSDTETTRVIEDLVGGLIQKKLLLRTDLPRSARQKIMQR